VSGVTAHPDRTIALSGGFDIIHPGHVRLVKAAQHFGRVLIILNSDDWVRRNKGGLIMPWNDRREVLLSLEGVHRVEPVEDGDGTVCEAIERLRPHIFGNGGLTSKRRTPERKLCHQLGIACVWGLGGGEFDQYSNQVLGALRKETW
jgi:cytidyltransferase-like protein